MAWQITATATAATQRKTNRSGTYDGRGSAFFQLVETYQDQPTANRRAQMLALPNTRWNTVEVKEV